MAETEHPQIYLITPPEIDLSTFPDRLAAGARRPSRSPASGWRSPPATRTASPRAADALREVAHARDVALVIDTHLGLMVERLGLDGVHLTDGARSVRKARKELGDDAIVGAFCGASRHDGMNAGEAGADYVSFGPVGATRAGRRHRGGVRAVRMVVRDDRGAGGGRRRCDRRPPSRASGTVTDFFGFGEEIWRARRSRGANWAPSGRRWV